ncbi:MAG: hypothetical protein RIQ68_419, partial [Pseudomonadota bacterium]
MRQNHLGHSFIWARRAQLATLALTLSLVCQSAQARDFYRWVQYGPSGLEARVVTDDATCPMAKVDGQDTRMIERSAPGQNYPVRGCALALPKTVKLVSIEGVPLPLPKPRAERILIMGDTGCRLKGA